MGITFARKFISNSRFLVSATVIFLIKYSPIIFLVFMAYGDQFLPEPLNKFSRDTRTTVNDILTIGSDEDSSQPHRNRPRKTDEILENMTR